MKNLLILKQTRGRDRAGGQDQAAGGSVGGACEKDDMAVAARANVLALLNERPNVSVGASVAKAILQ
jgi:hypothetical protein